MNTQKTILALAVAAVAAIPAYALTDGPYTGFYSGPTLNDYTTLTLPGGASITVPAFNTLFGTLNSIDFTWTGKVGSTQSARNPNSVNDVTGLTLQGTATLRISTPGSALTVATVFPAVINTQATVAPLQTASFAERFTTVTDAQTIANGGSAITDPSILAAFSSNGAANIILPVTGTLSTLSGTTTGSIDQLSIVGRASSKVVITYNYSANETQVPEPRVYGAIGAVACLGLLGYRRLRARQAAQA